MFNVKDFKTNISKRGYMTTNKFVVRITPPSGLKPIGNQLAVQNQGSRDGGDNTINFTRDAEYLQYYAEGAPLPGVNLLTSDIRRYGYGATEKKPIVAAFNDINLTIVNDKEGRNIRFFQNWMKLMVNYDARKSYRTATGIAEYQNPFEVEYKKYYAGTVEILLYEPGNDRDVLHYTFREAYPINVIDTPLNWADENNLLRFPVTFTFFDWYEKRIVANKRNID